MTIGIDEAGRGALAGPVVVAAVLIPKGFYPRSAVLPKLRDSKKLSQKQRAVWFAYMKTHPDILYATARVYERGIERINIARAANLAASRALDRILRDTQMHPSACDICIDGSLYLGSRTHRSVPAKTLVRGDEKRVAIKLASIAAKETRDAYMVRLGKKHYSYRFDLHKGYGTDLHRALLYLHGPCDAHRLTYLEKHLEWEGR